MRPIQAIFYEFSSMIWVKRAHCLQYGSDELRTGALAIIYIILQICFLINLQELVPKIVHYTVTVVPTPFRLHIYVCSFCLFIHANLCERIASTNIKFNNARGCISVDL